MLPRWPRADERRRARRARNASALRRPTQRRSGQLHAARRRSARIRLPRRSPLPKYDRPGGLRQDPDGVADSSGQATRRTENRMSNSPKPFEPHESGAFLHGTKADLSVGDLLVPGHRMNYDSGRNANHVYVTQTLDAAAWGAELAVGEGRGRIYLVEPTGAVEDDPNVTDKKFPGNPTRSYRSRDPLTVVGEVDDWTRLTPQALQVWRERLAAVRADERGEIIN